MITGDHKMPEKKSRELIIRMYRQGLGDCFLLTFPGEPKPFNLLIDCGALNSKHYDAEIMKDVVRDIKVRTDSQLDAVAATHEHWDHISGFSQAKEIFDEIKVDNVWAAWTEEPDNTAAQQLKKEFKKSKKAVAKALEQMPDETKNHQLGLYKEAIKELFGFFGGLAASEDGAIGTTGRAWQNFLNLSKKKVYCNPKKQPIELDGAEGVRVYVLGPPEDAEYIRKKLSKKETYDEGKHNFSAFSSFAAAFATDGDEEEKDDQVRAFPFDGRYRISADQDAPKIDFFRRNYGFSEKDENEWRRIDYDWLSQAGELALHLDSYTNNTCLALAIELGESRKVLLFPGDAQVGNWLSWEKLSWTVKNSDGTTRTVTTDDLLARTVFYKVGHHGSHNATMRAKGLEKMTSPDLVAMIPVHRETAEDQKWEFPYAPLWKRLREKTAGRVILADAENLDEIAVEAQQMLSDEDWEEFKNATKFDKLCIEYRIAY
jgi:hypothetical protein